MKLLILSFICTILGNAHSEFESAVPDYYWRDFDGVVPYDAVQGGIDEAGKQSFIGQAYIHLQGLIPATLYEDTKTICTSIFNGGKACISDYMKILCTRNIRSLKWIQVKNEETHLLADCRLVEGGTETGHVLYVGRVKHGRETLIGKVFPNYLSYSGLYLPFNASSEAKYTTFEILTYNCNIKNANVSVIAASRKHNPDNTMYENYY